MRDIGNITKLVEKASSGTLMVMCSKASGRMIKPMDMEFIYI